MKTFAAMIAIATLTGCAGHPYMAGTEASINYSAARCAQIGLVPGSPEYRYCILGDQSAKRQQVADMNRTMPYYLNSLPRNDTLNLNVRRF